MARGSCFLALFAIVSVPVFAGGASLLTPASSGDRQPCLHFGLPVSEDCAARVASTELRPAPAPSARFSLVSSPEGRRPLFRYPASFDSMSKKGKKSKGAGTKPPYVAPNWVAGKKNTATWITTGVVAGGWAALWINGDDDTITSVGDVTQIFTLATGLGMGLGAKDWKGTMQLVKSGLVTFGAVHLLKETNEKYRPDGSDANSYPSGHTAASFAGASYILNRYGPKWGIPAMIMASYTGFSRVYGQKHFTDDILSGMSIALFSNWLFVRPSDPERLAKFKDKERRRRHRFEWETGDGDVSRNLVQSPAETGTPIDFRFSGSANPQLTASIAYDFGITERHNLHFRWTPFEVREVDTTTSDIELEGTVIPAGDVFSIYFMGDIRARYGYQLVPDSKFDVQVGGGLMYIDTTLDLFPADFSTGEILVDEQAGATVVARGIVPIAYLRLGYDFSKLIGLYFEGDGYAVSAETFYDVVGKLRFQIGPRWDLALGYRTLVSDLEIQDLKNDFKRSGGLVHIAYSF